MTLSTALSVRTLTLGGGVLAGGGGLTLLGPGSSWRNAYVSCSGGLTVAHGGDFVVGPGTNGGYLIGCPLTNHGTLTITFLEYSQGASLSNAADGVVDLHSDATYGGNIYSIDNSTATFTNAGTMIKTGTTTSPDSANEFGVVCALAGTGPIAVQTGGLDFDSGGSQSGAVTLAAGTTLTLGGQNAFTLTPGSSLSGAGSLRCYMCTASVLGGCTITGGITVDQFSNLLFAPTTAVPAQAFIQVDNNSVMTQNVPLTCAVLHLGWGTLTGSGSLTLTGVGSTMTRSGILGGGAAVTVAHGATLLCGSSSDDATLDHRVLTNHGALTVTLLNLANGASVVNASDGALDLHSDATAGGRISARDATPCAVTSAGSVTKSGTNLVSVVNEFDINAGVAFTSTGPVAVQTGTLGLLGGGSQAGATSVAAGATVFPGGTADFTFGPASTITGAGSFQTNTSPGQASVLGGYGLGGTLTVHGNLLFAPTGAVPAQTAVEVLGGTLTQNAPLTTASIHLATATVQGPGALTITGAGSLWGSGAIVTGSGSLTVAPGATLDIATDDSAAGVLDQRTLTNHGRLTVARLGCGQAAALVNAADGVVELQATTVGSGALTALDSSALTVTNAGALVKTGALAAGVQDVAGIGAGIALTSTGTIAVQAGKFGIRGGGSQAGATTVAAGATLTIDGTVDFAFSAASSITGAGAFAVTDHPGQARVLGGYGLATGLSVAGNLLFAPTGAIATLPFVNVRSGTLTQNVAVTCAALHLTGNGALQGTGDLTITGAGSTWDSGATLAGTGALTLAPGAAMAVGATATAFLDHRALTNHGNLTITALSCSHGPALVNAADGVLDLHTVITLGQVSTGSGDPLTLGNAGLLTRTGPDAVSEFAVVLAAPLANTGDISVQSGTLHVYGGLSQTAGGTHLAGGVLAVTGGLTMTGGRLDGAGALTADVVNSGATVAPGGPTAGTIAITGTYRQTAGGTLAIDLGGTTAAQHDALTVSGAVALGGTLTLALIDGNTLVVGDAFPVVSGQAVSSDFALMNGTTSSATQRIQRAVSPTAVTLSVVGKPAQTVTFAPPAKTYGNAPFALAASASSNLPVTFALVSGPGTLSGAVLTITGAGSIVVTASQAGDGTFLPAATTATVVVQKAVLTATAANATRAYGAANPAFSVALTGFVNGEGAGVIDTRPTAATSATPASAVGTYAITPSGGSDDNYAFTAVPGALTVTRAALTITADAKSKVYGAALPTPTATFSGFANGDTSSSLATPAVLSPGASAASAVGTYPITVFGATSPNYAITFVPGALTVLRAPLTIAADDQGKVQGTANPPLTASITGFVNGDTVASLATPPALGTTAVDSSPDGTYPITVAGATSPNYAITFLAGTLTVADALPQTILFAAPADHRYGDAPFALVASATSGLAVTFTVQSGPATLAGGVVTLTGAGTVTVRADQAGSAAVQAANPVVRSFAVAKAPLLITANDQHMVAGGALPALTVSFSGFVGGDGVSRLDAPPLASTTATSASPAGTYPITIAPVTATDYAATLVAGNLAVVEVAAPAPGGGSAGGGAGGGCGLGSGVAALLCLALLFSTRLLRRPPG